jgi:hypothetical protein
MRFYLSTAWRYGIKLLFLGLCGCVEPYMPDVVAAPTSYLVVDGFINGNGVTRITLARTVNVASTAAPPPEKGAKIFIVDETGRRYALTEIASGTYQSDSLMLNPLRQYQLRFTTTSNADYASDLVPLKVTPPIEALTWRLDGDRIQLLLSTHDAQQRSRYYRWGCVETWEFNSAFNSVLEYDKALQVLVKRTTPIYTCWRTERLSTIMQGSSAHLSQDALIDFSYYAIARRAERLKIRYSALVSQYAETAEEFAYYCFARTPRPWVLSTTRCLPNSPAIYTASTRLPSQCLALSVPTLSSKNVSLLAPKTYLLSTAKTTIPLTKHATLRSLWGHLIGVLCLPFPLPKLPMACWFPLPSVWTAAYAALM